MSRTERKSPLKNPTFCDSGGDCCWDVPVAANTPLAAAMSRGSSSSIIIIIGLGDDVPGKIMAITSAAVLELSINYLKCS